MATCAFCLLLAACRSAPPARRYQMHGEVVALNADEHIATIKHGPIGDWMGAMTMEYPVKDAADWKRLTVGAHIDATVFVSEGAYYIGEVKINH
jgi:Cu/Ag efflux protein CusF